jgi:hypothetical protein
VRGGRLLLCQDLGRTTALGTFEEILEDKARVLQMEKMNMRRVEVNSEGIMDLNLVLLASGGNGSQVRVVFPQDLSIPYLYLDSMSTQSGPPTQSPPALLLEVKHRQYWPPLLPPLLPPPLLPLLLPPPPLPLLLEAKVVHLPHSLLLLLQVVKAPHHLSRRHLATTLLTHLHSSSS